MPKQSANNTIKYKAHQDFFSPHSTYLVQQGVIKVHFTLIYKISVQMNCMKSTYDFALCPADNFDLSTGG
jgi:hypothetical protein